MYKDFSQIKKKKRLITSLAIFMSFGLVLPNSFTGPAQARATTCITVISGNGPEGSLDPVVQFFNGSNYEDAFIIPPHVDNDGQPPDTNYAVIAGTHYVAVTNDGHGAEQTDHLFRATFTLPPVFTSPTFSIQVHCDNQATRLLNGHNLGSQPFAEDVINFQDPAEVFTSNNAAHFLPGVNTIDLTVHNFTEIG